MQDFFSVIKRVKISTYEMANFALEMFKNSQFLRVSCKILIADFMW